MATSTISIEEIRRDTATVTLIGKTGLYCHRMTTKAKHQLMLGGRRKTAAERATIKHHPRDEFLASMHVRPGMHEQTDVVFPAMALKSAMATAALVVSGIKKTDVQRLVFLPDEWVPIYGVPALRMDITRSADIGKTPDVRTRAYFPAWATQITVMFARPQLSRKDIGSLLHNAGVVCGIGDFRQEKGKGSYGTFEVADEVPEELLDLAAQRDALQTPRPFDADTAELLGQYDQKVAEKQ